MSRNAPQLPINAATPNNISVVSSTGFAAGELVYFNNGDYGTISNTAFSSDSFNISAPLPSYNVNVGGFTSLATNYGAGTTNNRFCQKLSNGNFVYAYVRPGNTKVYFQIVDSTGVVIVAETLVSNTIYTYNSSASVGVAALSGGGFALAWIGGQTGSGYITYAVYSNTGAVVLAPIQDTVSDFSATYCYPAIQSLANGNFVIACNDTSNVCYYRIFNANGTAAYAWVNPGFSSSSSAVTNARLAARSDSSFIILSGNNSNRLGYTIISATNTVLVGNSYITAPSAGFPAYDVTTLVDGTTFVIAYSNNNSTSLYGPIFRFLPSSNTLGAIFGPLPSAGVSTSLLYTIAVLGLADGTFMLCWANSQQFLQYAVYNGSGTCVSGTSGGAMVPKQIPGSLSYQYTRINLVENTSTIDIYNGSTYYNEIGFNEALVKVNKTTYNLVPTVSGVNTLIGTSIESVSGYAKTGSSPSKASFYASASSAPAATSSFGSYVLPPTVAASSAVLGCSSDVLANGNIIIAYSEESGGAVVAKVFTPSGALVTTINPGTVYSTAVYNGVKVSAMTNGGFVISFSAVSSSRITNAVYSSAYALISSNNVNYASYNFGMSNSTNFGLCGIGNNRYVISVYSYYFVYDGATSNQLTVGSTKSGDIYGVQVTPTKDGGFAFGGYYTSYGTTYYDVMYPTDSTGTSFSTRFSLNGTADFIGGGYSGLAGLENNAVYAITQGSATSVTPQVGTASSSLVSISTQNLNNSGTYGQIAVGTSGFGNVVTIYYSSATTYRMITGPASLWDGVTIPTGYAITLSGIAATTTNYRSSFSIRPMSGTNILFSWVNSSNFPSFAVINSYPVTASATLVAGVTPSAGVPLSVANGYVFAGVSSSAASAGGVGQLQINGSAQLNSSYSASLAYQAFDFQNPGVLGVRGTIVGRNVNLQGNN